MNRSPVEAVRAYIDRVNAADVGGLVELMTPDHVFYVDGEAPLSGREAMRKAWSGYFAAYPTYRIHVDEVYDRGEQVVVAGHTSGSHVPAAVEQVPRCVLWEARVVDGLVATWVIYPASPENRRRFGLP